MRDEAPEVWQGICAVVRELNGLMPYLTARKTAHDDIAAPGPLRTWTREADGTRVLAVVNITDPPAEAALDLTSFGVDEVRERGTGAAVRLRDGQLTIDFGAHEVKVYEWDVQP